MPALVYRITEVLSAITMDLPIGTNLGLYYVLWALISGQFLPSRGALIPALAALELAPAVVRRAWAAFAYGAWDVSRLIAVLLELVQREGRWHAQRCGGYRVVAVDTVAFFRPRLKGCATKHYLSQAGRALPAIPFGLLANIGHVESQTVPIVRQIVRAPSASEADLNSALLKQVATQLADDEASVVDRGFSLRKLQAAKVPRWVNRVPSNFTAERVTLPEYCGKGRRPSRGARVRPLAGTYRGQPVVATPPDRTETISYAGRLIQAEIWDGLRLPRAGSQAPSFQCVVVRDPVYPQPWVLASNLPLPAAELLAFYRERWPIEQVPLVAKQLLGTQRQFVWAAAARQRLPELALLAGSLLMYLAATHPAQATGFWDRTPQPTAGRLRRVLARLDISQLIPLPSQLRKKASVTAHLPKGIDACRRSAPPNQARV